LTQWGSLNPELDRRLMRGVGCVVCFWRRGFVGCSGMWADLPLVDWLIGCSPAFETAKWMNPGP
jgi:hypothetical protein